MKKILIGAGAALAGFFGVTVAVLPAQARTADTEAAMENVQQNRIASSGKSDQKRYCIVDDITGSRIPVKTCKTRKEWKAEGVEIPAGR